MKKTALKTTLATCLATLAGALNLLAANLTWDADAITANGAQDGTGNWTSLASNTNWWDGAANVTWNNATPDNAIFGAGNGTIPGVVTIPSGTTNTVGGLTFNAPGVSGYTIAGSSSTTSKLELSGTPTIAVASGVFATNNAVTSGTGFVKDGTGTFVLGGSAANIYAGTTMVTNGTLVLSKSDNIVSIPGDLVVASGATVVSLKKAQLAGTANLTVNGTFDTGGKILLVNSLVADNNAQILSASSSVAITNTTIYDVRSGFIFPNLAGAAGLTKTTGGTVVLTNGGGVNSFSGPILVSAGILELGHSGVGGGLPANTVTITNTGMLRLGKDTQIQSNAPVIIGGGTFELNAHNETLSTVILDNGGQILNGGSASKTLTVLTNMDFRNGLCASRLGGAGLMTKTTAGSVVLSLDNANTGGTLISAGILQLGDGSSTNRGQFGTGPVTNNAVIVLNHSGSFTVTNDISGTGSLTNLGGTATLIGNNTYAGDTTVSGGTVLVNNTLGNGTVTVQLGAGLGGTGTIGGAVNIQSAGKLTPGNGGIGTLTINGALALSAGSTNTFDVNGATPANDTVALGSSVTYGGVLKIVSSGTFTGGQQFVLFSGTGATNTSNFASIESAVSGFTFGFTNGVLTAISTINVNPPQIQMSVSGSTLTLGWPTNAGWILQSNSVNLADSASWFNYPADGSVGVTSVNITMDPVRTNVFFRMLKP